MNLIDTFVKKAPRTIPKGLRRVISGPAGRIIGDVAETIINRALPVSVPEAPDTIEIVGRTIQGETRSVRISKSVTAAELAEALGGAFGRRIQNMSLRGLTLEEDQTLSDLGMRDGDVVLLSKVFQGGEQASL